MTAIPPRSALYVPATNERAIAKARGLACDMVILDLEDSVAPDAKAAAREQALAVLAGGVLAGCETMVRINGLDTAWGIDDLRACAAAGVPAILLPKVNDTADGRRLAAQTGGGIRFWAMIETCRAVLAVKDIAAAGGFTGFVMGINDLAKEMGARQTGERLPFLGFLAQSVAAAKAHGLTILDGVYNDIGDADGFARQCAQGAEFGFDGKTLIHPSQIGACNAAFTPTDDEIGWAETIVAAYASPEHADAGVIRVEGRMVERLHLDQARRTLAMVAAIRARAPA